MADLATFTSSREFCGRSDFEFLNTIGPDLTCRLASVTSAFGVRADMTNADRHFRF